MVSETKLDNSFPMGEFEMEGYSTPVRLDRMVVALFFTFEAIFLVKS